MTPQVKASIQQVYRVFSGYPLNSNMEASSLYSIEKVKMWNASISTQPMPTLSGDELAFFAFKVGYTWGTQEDYKHFLPRFLELISSYKEEGMESSIVFKKLNYFNWTNWAETEQMTIQIYLDNFWLQLVNDPTLPYQFQEHFESIFQIHTNPSFMLKTWLASESWASIEQFCNIILYHSHDITRRNNFGIFDKKQDNYTTLTELLMIWSKGEMKAKLESLIFEQIEDKLMDKILETIDVLEY